MNKVTAISYSSDWYRVYTEIMAEVSPEVRLKVEALMDEIRNLLDKEAGQ